MQEMDQSVGLPTGSGKYCLLAKIATGGMGELFLARLEADHGFEEFVVVKRILPHLTDKPDFVDMFVNEARIAARLSHPNLCQTYKLGEIDGRYYMALEYLEGVLLVDVTTAGKHRVKLVSSDTSHEPKTITVDIGPDETVRRKVTW